MNRIRKVAIGTVLAATVVGVGIAGVSAANAAAPGDAESHEVGETHKASVSLNEDGTVTQSGDIVPVDPADVPVWDAETERKIEEAGAAYPDGAIISIDENGEVTAEPLPDDSGVVTFSVESGGED